MHVTMQALEGTCPASGCNTQLYFIAKSTEPVECFKCGARHNPGKLLNVKPVSDSIGTFLKNFQKYKSEQLKNSEQTQKKRDPRVKKLSNYGSKLISPLLTKYGLDKGTHEVKLLSTMGQGNTFDCSHLSNRAFMIEAENLDVPEYGRDDAAVYLQDTIKEILFVNGNEERLVPIYADGDGHCLLHAISRALVGRELFWHPLLTNLKDHFTKRQSDYKALLGDFIQDSEWQDIIKEADPNYLPAYGETHGLRNIHVFGLANVLHRPVILIDSLEGMNSKGDYCALFVPALVPLEKCKGSDGRLNKPIVIAWSSKGHNHFVPLVGIKGKPVPRYPYHLLPKIWGLPQDLLPRYIEFEEQTCVIGGSKTLSEAYLGRLVNAMENHYRILNGVAPSVVADVNHYIYKPSSLVGMSSQMVMEAAHALVKEERLHKCLLCGTVIQKEPPCSLSWLVPGGKLYDLATKFHGSLKDGCTYKFPADNVVCKYDKAKNKLKFIYDVADLKCKDCAGSLRLIKPDGSLVYYNGDKLSIPAGAGSRCGCGFKHYWDGKEYDSLPIKIPIFMEWTGTKKEDVVYWFQNESDSSLNSNAFELAQKVVQKHFPGEFGSERLVQKVVDQIFRVTLKNKSLQKKVGLPPLPKGEDGGDLSPSSKIILTGAKSKTIHKEELNTSKKEQILRSKIEHSAAMKQKRMSTSPNKQAKQFLESVQNEKGVDVPVSVSNEEKVESRPTVSPPKARKIRISTSNQGNLTYTLSDETSYSDIQMFIEENFKIDRDLQIIKYGFPPKTLAPSNGDESAPVNLKSGERLMVHVKKVERPDTLMEVYPDVSSLEEDDLARRFLGSAKPDPSTLASSLFSLLETVDLWSCVCTQRSMFQRNGLFYKQAFTDLDTVEDKKHFSLPYFPNKLFAYCKEVDEVYLCLGKTHIPVQPLSPEQTALAHKQVGAISPRQPYSRPSDAPLKQKVVVLNDLKAEEPQRRASDLSEQVKHHIRNVSESNEQLKIQRSISDSNEQLEQLLLPTSSSDAAMDKDDVTSSNIDAISISESNEKPKPQGGSVPDSNDQLKQSLLITSSPDIVMDNVSSSNIETGSDGGETPDTEEMTLLYVMPDSTVENIVADVSLVDVDVNPSSNEMSEDFTEEQNTFQYAELDEKREASQENSFIESGSDKGNDTTNETIFNDSDSTTGTKHYDKIHSKMDTSDT